MQHVFGILKEHMLAIFVLPYGLALFESAQWIR